MLSPRLYVYVTTVGPLLGAVGIALDRGMPHWDVWVVVLTVIGLLAGLSAATMPESRRGERATEVRAAERLRDH